jgi:hypothetical protein
MDDIVFSSGFNLANMRCQLVELGNFNPTFPYFYQLERQICKIEAAKSRAVVSDVVVAIPVCTLYIQCCVKYL